MGHTDSPLCSYCGEEKETTKHLFFDCACTQNAWKELKIHFAGYLNIPNLELQSAVVGFLDKSNENLTLLNCILLTFKMVLYKNRDKKRFNLNTVLTDIKSRERIESISLAKMENILFIPGNGRS